MQKRVNIVTTVNAKNIQRAGNRLVIKDMVPIVDDIVMNGGKYPGEEIAKGYKSLDGVPAPAGHPKDSKGNYISARNGEALMSAYIGAVVTNSRHTGGRVLVDLEINEDQANAMPEGRELVGRLTRAMNGEEVEPIHVSTGLLLQKMQGNGKSRGKSYSWIAKNMDFDHVAILLNEEGAGTPKEGVGLFLNSAGEQEKIEVCKLNPADAIEDKRNSLMRWIAALVGNSEMSFSEIGELLQAEMGGYSEASRGYVCEIYSKEFIYRSRDDRYYKQAYFIDAEGVVSLQGEPVEVRREVEFKEVQSNREESHMKEQIVAALNAAGVSTEGMSDAQILAAYNSVVTKPVDDKLNAANSKISEFEQAANAARDAEIAKLAESLAVNSALSVDDFKALGLSRLQELAKNSKAAPITLGSPAVNAKTTYELPE